MYYIGDKKYYDFIIGEKFYNSGNFIFSSDFPENNNEDYNHLVIEIV